MSLGDQNRFLELFDEIRQDECVTVTFACSNPDFGNPLPDEVVTVEDMISGTSEEFRADTLVECLEKAIERRKST